MGGSVKSKLWDSVEQENIEKVHKILCKYPDLLNEPLGKTVPYNCLTRAAWRGDINMVKYLVEEGADINRTGKAEI